MQPKSLSHLSKEIIQKNLRNSELEKMLKKDLPKEDYNRLKENTLLKVIRECLEKRKDEYIFCLNLVKEYEEFDDVLIVCQLAHGHYKIVIVNLNTQLRNVIIEEEKETKKYFKRNDFNVLKGFRQFLVELDTYLKIKLNKKFMKYTLEEMLEMDEIDESLDLRMDEWMELMENKDKVNEFLKEEEEIESMFDEED